MLSRHFAMNRVQSHARSLEAPLVVHVIHALGVGGLENGLVNLINQMPAAAYRHAIVCMTSSTDFRRRIGRDGVDVIEMKRGSVPLWRTYLELHARLRRLRPSIVHTRNLSGLDALLPSLCAGVRVRVHGEHGRDADDLQGSNPRYRRLRRLFRPLITHYTAVSKDLERYLAEQVGVPRTRISQIYNGVDTTRFHPPPSGHDLHNPNVAVTGRGLRIGTVGRLQAVKDQMTLVRSFARALQVDARAMGNSSLVIAGDGPLRTQIEAEVRLLGLGNRIELLGQRDDIAEVLRSFDLFVLPSRDEGISNTLLEAMATALPILATRVGGNPELVREGRDGRLVAAGDSDAMAGVLVQYARDDTMRRSHGESARRRAHDHFSLQAMVGAYRALYDRLLGRTSSNPVNVKKSMILP